MRVYEGHKTIDFDINILKFTLYLREVVDKLITDHSRPQIPPKVPLYANWRAKLKEIWGRE